MEAVTRTLSLLRGGVVKENRYWFGVGCRATDKVHGGPGIGVWGQEQNWTERSGCEAPTVEVLRF